MKNRAPLPVRTPGWAPPARDSIWPQLDGRIRQRAAVMDGGAARGGIRDAPDVRILPSPPVFAPGALSQGPGPRGAA